MTAEAIHPSVSPETAEKLRRVVAAINPAHFDMADWIDCIVAPLELISTNVDACKVLLRGEIACGTVACLAGWAVAVLANGERGGNIRNCAVKLLGITYYSSNRLFIDENWPEEFRAPYQSAEHGSAARLDILRDRVEHFIATGE